MKPDNNELSTKKDKKIRRKDKKVHQQEVKMARLRF